MIVNGGLYEKVFCTIFNFYTDNYFTNIFVQSTFRIFKRICEYNYSNHKFARNRFCTLSTFKKNGKQLQDFLDNSHHSRSGFRCGALFAVRQQKDIQRFKQQNYGVAVRFEPQI